jgi:hypothetical protein
VVPLLAAISSPVPSHCLVRSKEAAIEKRLYRRINRNGDTSAANGVAAAGRITSGWHQSLMREGSGYRGYCPGCLYFAKPLIVDKEERVITLQWPSDSSTELIADE